MKITKKRFVNCFIIFVSYLSLSSVLLAYRPTYFERCSRKQNSLSYFLKEKLIQEEMASLGFDMSFDYPPGKAYKNFELKLIESKYLATTTAMISNRCSFGVSQLSNEVNIYCAYHGNSHGCWLSENLSSSSYFLNRYSNHSHYSLVYCIAAIIISGIITSLKS